MKKAVIETRNVAVVQDEKIILQNVNITLYNGELVFLIGKVGSGKTSLIRTFYADIPLSSGSAKINEFELGNITRNKIPYLRRSLGIVFQDFKLLTDRSVYDNLKFVLDATGWKDLEKINKRIKEVLEDAGLSNKEFKMTSELSGGEQQRVVIARALLNQPAVILADEPTGNLDPESSSQIMRILKSITLRGSCVLIATHQYDLIKRFPGRVLRIENGQINEIGAEEV